MEGEIVSRLDTIQSELNYLSAAILIYIAFSLIRKAVQITLNFRSGWQARWRDKAYDYFEREKYRNLLDHCEWQLKDRPNLVMAVWWKARAHQELGNIQEAIENYNRVLYLEPSYKDQYVIPYFDVDTQELRSS